MLLINGKGVYPKSNHYKITKDMEVDSISIFGKDIACDTSEASPSELWLTNDAYCHTGSSMKVSLVTLGLLSGAQCITSGMSSLRNIYLEISSCNTSNLTTLDRLIFTYEETELGTFGYRGGLILNNVDISGGKQPKFFIQQKIFRAQNNLADRFNWLKENVSDGFIIAGNKNNISIGFTDETDYIMGKLYFA